MIVYEVKDINPALIKKINYKSEKDWLELIYAQYGFANLDEIRVYAKDKDEWFNDFYWTEETEGKFLGHVLALYPKARHKEITDIYKVVSISVAPTNIKKARKNGKWQL